jgi:hypothetical protein
MEHRHPQVLAHRRTGGGAAGPTAIENWGADKNAPTAISPPGLAQAGGHLAASQQFGNASRTDVFVVSTDGATEVLWVQGGGGWNGPAAL